MPSNKYSIVEPHPSVPRPGAYLAGGRGGAGNYRRYNSSELTSGPTATGPPSRFSLGFGMKRGSSSTTTNPPTSSQQPPSSHPKTNMSTGIGGAGNMFARAETEERVFQFDEEMVKRRDGGQAPVYHIGRGGGGNWVDESVHGAATTPTPAAVLASKQPPRAERTGSSSSTASSNGSVHSSDRGQGQVRRSVEGAFGRWRERLTS